MDLLNLPPAFEDDRGSITDLIQNDRIDAVTLITFNQGAVRANHYHKETVQWNFVVSGRFLLVTQQPGETIKECTLEKGAFAVTQPNEAHALKALTDSELLVFTRGPRAGQNYEEDTFRVVPPLI